MAEVTRQQVEELLYLEAALLDEWRLKEWLELLTEDVRYEVPTTDARDGAPERTLSIVADDADRLRARVEQLLGTKAWVENPKSRTRRFVTNVRILNVNGDRIEVAANFLIYRMRVQETDVFCGRYEYALAKRGESLRIQKRRAILDLEWLRPHGKVSIIL